MELLFRPNFSDSKYILTKLLGNQNKFDCHSHKNYRNMSKYGPVQFAFTYIFHLHHYFDYHVCLSIRPSVCPSFVRLSVRHNKTKGTLVHERG